MTIKKMYEYVNLRLSIDERTFIAFFNETVADLVLLYEAKYIYESEDNNTDEIPKIDSLGDDNPIFEVYHIAILYNILYLCGLGDNFKSEYLQKAESAYLKKWNEASGKSGVILKREDW